MADTTEMAEMAEMARLAEIAEMHKRALQHQRERRIRLLNEAIAGRDLVATTLSTPNEVLKSQALRDVVLGRAPYFRDQDAMVRRITKVDTLAELITLAAHPEDGRMPVLLDAWKLIICDARQLEEGASLQDAYNAQLREEELQTPAERAREIVRSEEEKTARRNARWYIPALEELAKTNQLDKGNTKSIWKQVSPAPPAWIQQILRAQQPWGFVVYKTSEVEKKYGHKYSHDWGSMWNDILEHSSHLPYSWEDRSLIYACICQIHCNGHSSTVRKLWKLDWPTRPLAGDLVADNAVRQHFRHYRESLSSPGILRNTFIVVDAASIPENIEDTFITHACDIYWVWAYDADWEPSLSTDNTTLDGEEYQGRVKVAIYSLDAWFYAARYEGVNLRDMWLKAQKHPQKLWVCYSTALEEWNHEPYI